MGSDVKFINKLIPNAKYELPYEGAKKMILVEDVDNKELLVELLLTIYKELPAKKTIK